MADLSSEGSPSVPQQPVERWTIYAGPNGSACMKGFAGTLRCPENYQEVEVVPALVAERLASAARRFRLAHRRAMRDSADKAWMTELVDAGSELDAALEVYESGGATKPGEES